MTKTTKYGLALAVSFAALLPAADPGKPEAIGYEDTPVLPNSKWRVHDLHRPRPAKVTPGPLQAAPPPSDAIVLFGGKDLSKWSSAQKGQVTDPKWKVANGYIEAVPGVGDLITKERFGDCQLHIEWQEPENLKGNSQSRGNSGVILMSRYEIQVLDSYENVTYADGQAGAVYGQHPPLVNASRKAGEWQSYDIAFEAPRFENGKLVKPGYVTVFHNGVLVQNHSEIIGTMVHRKVAVYSPHENGEPFMLQGHGNPVRFRNIWIRPLQPRP